MLEPTSRYAGLDVATTTVPDGAGGQRAVRYLRRRFPPQPSTLPTLAEHPVSHGDRLDLIAARYLGDPTQFWRICDANLAIHPAELTAGDRIGEVLRVPVPQV
ncbi:MAG TPA: LysM domain-containing protein [Pilimelia sp.]|nr:LysM domain-containing protein [Pilimelia sp.]